MRRGYNKAATGHSAREVRAMFFIYLVGALAGIVVFSAIGILGH